MKNLNYNLIAIAIIGILFGLYNCNKAKNNKEDLNELNALYTAATDTLTKYRNSYNEEVALTDVLIARNQEAVANLAIADANVKKLQDIIKRKTAEGVELKAAIYLANQTIIKLQDSLENMIAGYEVDPEHPDSVYPIYTREFIDDEWITGNLYMGRYTFSMDVAFRNAYEITIEDEKVSLFKYKTIATVVNKNPYTNTEVMKVYTNQEEPVSRFKWFRNGMITGGGIGLILILLL